MLLLPGFAAPELASATLDFPCPHRQPTPAAWNLTFEYPNPRCLQMRCQQCGHSNPEDHRFCGMCGSKLEPKNAAIAIDENDPLDLEAPVYNLSERRAASGERRSAASASERDRQREVVRDTAARNPISVTSQKPVSAESFPTNKVEDE